MARTRAVKINDEKDKQLMNLIRERGEFRSFNNFVNLFIDWFLENPEQWEYRRLELKEQKTGEEIELLKMVYMVKEYQKKPSVANQGQSLDGYSALANFNSIAEKIEQFFKSKGLELNQSGDKE